MTFPILTTTQEATLNANLPNWIYYFNSYFKQVQKIFLDIAWLQPIIYCWKSLQEAFFFKNLCHNFFVRNPLIFLAPPKSRVVEDDNSNLDRCLGCNFNPAPPLLLLLRCPPSPPTVSWSKWSHFGKCFIWKCTIRHQWNIENLVWSQLNSIDYLILRGFRVIIGTF